MPRKIFQKIMLFTVSLLGSLILAEIILRMILFNPAPDKYYVWPPGLEQHFETNSDHMPGVFGESVFSINSLGLRGEELDPSAENTILVIGGSTAECLYLDDSEAWPALLESKLKQHGNVQVLNAGRSGYSSRHHILQMQYLLPQLPEVDKVLVLLGANDFLRRLHWGENYSPDYDAEELKEKAFLVRPIDSYHPFYKQLAIWHLIRKAIHARNISEKKDLVQDKEGEILVNWRKERQAAKELQAQLPAMQDALKEYETNLEKMAEIALEHEMELVFLTQPSLWKDSLSPELDRLLCGGALGAGGEGGSFYTTKAMADGLALYNESLKSFAGENRLGLIDLNQNLAKDTTVFYDDVHFNESGAHKVAEEAYRYWYPLEQADTSLYISPNSP